MKFHVHRNGKTKNVRGIEFLGVLESKYLYVSKVGTFLTLKHRDGLFRGFKRENGYYTVPVCKGRKIYAHRAVYEIITGEEIPEGKEIDHLNCKSDDNRIENLRCCTHSENDRNPISLMTLKAGLKKHYEDPEVREKMSKRQKDFYQTEYGKQLTKRRVEASQRSLKKLLQTPEFRKKLSDRSKLSNEKNKVAVIGHNVETNETRRFTSLAEAAQSLKIRIGEVQGVCCHRHTIAHGWKFEYENPSQKQKEKIQRNDEIIRDKKEKHARRGFVSWSRSVLATNDKTNERIVFKSIKEAANQTGVSNCAIYKSMKQRVIIKGWMFIEGEKIVNHKL